MPPSCGLPQLKRAASGLPRVATIGGWAAHAATLASPRGLASWTCSSVSAMAVWNSQSSSGISGSTTAMLPAVVPYRTAKISSDMVLF